MELNKRECGALIRLHDYGDEPDFTIKGDLSGVGQKTLQGLVDKGLIEIGPSKKFPGSDGWRMTAAGRHCLEKLRR